MSILISQVQNWQIASTEKHPTPNYVSHVFVTYLACVVYVFQFLFRDIVHSSLRHVIHTSFLFTRKSTPLLECV